MGLMVCWTLRLPPDVVSKAARARVVALRDRALALPFASVTPVVSGRGWGFRTFPVSEERQAYVRPVEAIRFSVGPGEGVEPAVLGVALQPPHTVVDAREVIVPDAGAWLAEACCETQRAAAAGPAAFVRWHASLVDLLDAARGIGFEVTVLDDARYWERRDAGRLEAELARWARFG